jgi:hypothetical protein
MTRQIRFSGVWPKLNNSSVFSVLNREREIEREREEREGGKLMFGRHDSVRSN